MLEDGSTYPLPGKLQFADVTVDQSTGSVTLRAVFPNPERRAAARHVRARAISEGVAARRRSWSRSAASPATRRARRRAGGRRRRQGRAAHADRPAAPSATSGWSPAGLKPGDRVIVEGLQKIQPGARGQARPRRSAAAAAASATGRPGHVAASSSTGRSSPGSSPSSSCWPARWRSAACRSRSIPTSRRRRSAISATYPGASAETRGEHGHPGHRAAVNGLDDLLYISSTSDSRPAR